MAGKHGPNRLSNYVDVHETVMEHLLRGGLVISDNLVFTPLRDTILIEGHVDCLGGIKVDVHKALRILVGEGPDALVQTVRYSYNVSIEGRGNVFRYDSPHETHNKKHHVHRYDVMNRDVVGTVAFTEHESDIPTLGDVIEEAVEWYFENYDALRD